jgi:GR25 family glycosyltransferase involved in LPS biosynthesis
MRVAVTIRFQNSYFSGSVPQIACALSRVLREAGHDVSLLYPRGEASWFIDLHDYADLVAPRVCWTGNETFDTVIEVAWTFRAEERLKVAPRRIGFSHYSPIFYDMESCVYQWNPTVRDFTNLTEMWTYDMYSKTDIKYLEFLSGVPVQTIPYIWDPDALDLFVKKENIPEWNDSAKSVERMLPKDAPESLSWCARIIESNFSNTSHSILPLNIVSEIRKRVTPIRFTVHNGDAVGKHPFFLTNVAKNLLLPDLSGNFVGRVRLPELRKEKTLFVAHSRFRPIKSYYLDALYLGIPMIHNNELVRNLGCPYYYELNQIIQATEAFKTLDADYKAGKNYFSPQNGAIRQKILRARFSPGANVATFKKVLEHRPTGPVMSRITPSSTAAPIAKPQPKNESGALRVAFAHMWDDFQPRHNFFMYLLSWIGSQTGINVCLDETNPNIVFFGPWSQGSERKWPGVPKVYYTGENSPPNVSADTFLNIGFAYNTESNYIRLPLWVLEVNWWGADVEKIVNPKPVSVAAATTSAPRGDRKKFCAFVATNPSNNNRNAAFKILDTWRGVESGGRLFCNRKEGPIPAGRGGGGGELLKVDYYKDFKFVITFENSSAPGYTTEKLFHAKVAGAVPIYWGDPFVDRDFDSRGFINANGISTPSDLVNLVQKIADDPSAYDAMARIPALSEFKQRWCERTMVHLASKIFKHVLNKSIEIKPDAWKTAESYGKLYESGVTAPLALTPSVAATPVAKPKNKKRLVITATNARYAESAVNLFASLNTIDSDCEKIVYVWPDVDKKLFSIFQRFGVDDIRLLPTDVKSVTPWADYWDPQHFAWKLWIHNDIMKNHAKDTSVLYIDSGTVITSPLTNVWDIIDSKGIFLLDDSTQLNERWCHDDFIRNMKATPAELKANQLWAGCVGFKTGGVYQSVIAEAVRAAENRETIVGEKWHRYNDVCYGHRHDQSILSILTQRANLPREPLAKFYCDTSKRAAAQLRVPFYVHRGNFKEFEPFAPGIDEAHVINLERRGDRLEKFHGAHPELRSKAYVLPAVDGRTLTLTQDIVHLFRSNDFKWKKAVMGCALSHYSLWEKLVNDKVAKSYLIMEDDVHFNSDWLRKWMSNVSKAPADADVIYLGGVLPPNMPAFPHIIEPVNAFFARVKKNTVFGGYPRRYFHFCNYAYILTKSGAEKIVKMIQERGIFTSGDHMIVNHGDDLLNIYFTTPLLARCWQDDDPVYQNSAFNDFSRIDKFDSDLWNNDEHFTETEIRMAATGASVPPAAPPTTPAPPAAPAPLAAPEPSRDEKQVELMNNFLRAVALKNSADVGKYIDQIFDLWASQSPDEIIKKLSWFRIFEQLLITKNDILQPYVPKVLEAIRTKFPMPLNHLWNNVLKMYDTQPTPKKPGIDMISDIPNNTITAWHMYEINPVFYECQWLDNIFPKPLEYKKFSEIQSLLETEGIPLVIYQRIPHKDVGGLYRTIVEMFESAGKQLILLHLSDEFGTDDISFYNSRAIKAVIRNYWRPNLPSNVYLVPLGYANGRGAKHMPPSPAFKDRANIFMFSGSLDRVGRDEALKKLTVLQPNDIHVREKWSDAEPQNAQAYNTSMRNAKFVPCFRGSKALESFRVYEALEHGAIPIYVPQESTSACVDEFKEQFGQNPLLGFPSWEVATNMLPKLAANTEVMEKHRLVLQKWWSDKKDEVCRKIAALF